MNPQAVKLFNELQQSNYQLRPAEIGRFGKQHELQESCGEEKARWSTQPYTLRPDWRRYNAEPEIVRR